MDMTAFSDEQLLQRTRTFRSGGQADAAEVFSAAR